MHIIVIIKGKHAGNIFPLMKKGVIVIGRSKASDITILDMLISRNHCQIENKRDGFFVKDLGSTNQTLLNNSTLEEETKLKIDDIITIGNTELLFTTRKDFTVRSVSDYEKFGMEKTRQIDL